MANSAMRVSICFLALLATLIPLCVCRSTPSPHVVHEKRDNHPHKWVKRDRLQPNAVLPLRIGLTQNDLHLGHDYLMEM